MSETVRVRFAPSPTGHLHVGGLRTALYNYLLAKKHGGTFILRIEDTDQKRFVPGAIKGLIHTLHEMGVYYEEGEYLDGETLTTRGTHGPYIQSERLALYREYTDKLLATKKAYYCFCTPERLEEMRRTQAAQKQAPRYDRHCLHLSETEIQERLAARTPHVVRFRMPDDREVIFTDLVRGTVRFHTKDADDHVLMKSDGYPTYHLAVVVDDHLMEITHVLRSEEWLPSAPKHLLLYEALGWQAPEFAHLSFILGRDGKKKLSKRDGGVSVEYFLSQGYLKEALVNFIVLLGWNPGKGNTQEIFSLEELEQVFDLSGLHKAGAVFDFKKLDWMNGEYIKRLTIDELYERALAVGLLENDFFKSLPVEKKSDALLKKVLTVEKERLVRLTDIGVHNAFFFADTLSYEANLLHWKNNDAAMTRSALEQAKDLLETLDNASWADTNILGEKLLTAAGEKRGDFLWPLRVALTGTERSPSPMEVAWVLGKEETLARIAAALAKLG